MAALFVDATHPLLWTSIATTMTAWAIGIVVCILIAVPGGLLLGSSTLSYNLSYLSLEFVRTVPSTAAIPLLILIYGSGLELAIARVVLGAVWPLLISTMYGVHDVDPIALEAAKVYGVGRPGLFRRVVLPSTLPYMATGLRLSATIGLILAISASLIGGGDGLGAAIADASNSSASALLYGRVFAAGVLGLALTAAFTLLERRLLFWHSSQRATGA
jgi:ABC-type nitrate/sulfonate/bicarbonate transport system permease component